MRLGNTNIYHLATIAILAVLLLVAARAAGASPAGSKQIGIEDGWFRALPPAVPSGGYFTIRNGSEKPVTLTDVETPGCGVTMMHRSINGSMDHVMSLDLAAGETVRFEPGGYHLMCIEAKLKPGGNVPVTFHFADGGIVTANFAIKTATGK